MIRFFALSVVLAVLVPVAVTALRQPRLPKGWRS